MSDRLLATIVELERALQEEVLREEKRAAVWREREVAEIGLAEQDNLLRMRDEEAQQLAAARQAAAAEAGRWQAAADTWCARLAALPDPFLEELLRRELVRVLPEAGDDHSHGQG